MQGASNRYVTAEMMMMLNLPYKYKENQGFTMKENNVDNLVIQLKGVCDVINSRWARVGLRPKPSSGMAMMTVSILL